MAVATFEGLAVGSTPTAAQAGADFISVPSGGGPLIRGDVAYRGTRSLELKTGSAGGSCYHERSTSLGASSTGKVFCRVRLMVPALPPDATGVRLVVITDSGGAFRGEVHLTNTGAVRLRDAAAATVATLGVTLAPGQWLDLGFSVQSFSATTGQLQITRWNGSGARVETLTSAATLNTLGTGGANRGQVGAIRSSGLNSWALIVDDLDWSTVDYPAIPPAATVLTGPWSGAQTPSGFTAGYRLSGAGSARLVVSTAADLSSPVYGSSAAPDADGIVQLPVTGLTAATRYYYGVECDGVLITGGRGEAATLPVAGAPASYSVAFGSCQWTQPTAQTFARMLARPGPYGLPLFLAHEGDMGYPDFGAGTTAAQVLAQHMQSLGSAAMAQPLSKLPMSYQPDNHDTGGDQADRLSPAMTVVMQQMRRVFPSHPLPASNGLGGYRSWVVGRVRWIQLDTRSYRDPQSDPDSPTKTMLGAEQLAWLKARLLDPEPLKIILGQHPWREDGVNSGRWGSYRYEFADINNHISTHGVQVFAAVGDIHALLADNGSAPGAYGVPQASGAPFQQGAVDPGSFWSAGYYVGTVGTTLQAFGVLDITDTGTAITVHYEGITSLDGITRVQMDVTYQASGSLPGVWGVNL